MWTIIVALGLAILLGAYAVYKCWTMERQMSANLGMTADKGEEVAYLRHLFRDLNQRVDALTEFVVGPEMPPPTPTESVCDGPVQQEQAQQQAPDLMSTAMQVIGSLMSVGRNASAQAQPQPEAQQVEELPESEEAPVSTGSANDEEEEDEA